MSITSLEIRATLASTDRRMPRLRLVPNWAVAILLLSGFIGRALGEEPRAEIPLHGESVLRFATVAEGQKRLLEPDTFTMALSQFDRQVRLGLGGDVTEADVRRHAAAQVIGWTDADAAKVTELIGSLRQRLIPFQVPLPPRVLLIQTNGRDEGEAAYCRYPAIVVPQQIVARDASGLERLLCHELFHIVSRHDAELRRRLYRLIGFESCEAIPAPATLRDRKITNPDAPLWDNIIALEIDSGRLDATPILIASVERFDPQAGGSLFKYLQFRLLAVEKDELGRWTAKLVNGQPSLFNPKEIPDYSKKIGRNTGYIIHPDEILADNFAHLVFRKADLPNPELIDKLRQEFTLKTSP